MIKKLYNGIVSQKKAELKAELYRNLLKSEAQIGGRVFGPLPKGVNREFFCLDGRTWIWHEEWINEKGDSQAKTTRYDVLPDNIFKAQEGQPYSRIGKQEAIHLRNAAIEYQRLVLEQLYKQVS